MGSASPPKDGTLAPVITASSEVIRPEAAFIFEGIGPDEVIGAFGIVGDGAAGDEVDRIDSQLGSPPKRFALRPVKANTVTPSNSSSRTRGSRNPIGGARLAADVRADLAYLAGENGGAVFSVGSINWIASLPHNNFDNNVSRISENVLRRLPTR